MKQLLGGGGKEWEEPGKEHCLMKEQHFFQGHMRLKKDFRKSTAWLSVIKPLAGGFLPYSKGPWDGQPAPPPGAPAGAEGRSQAGGCPSEPRPSPRLPLAWAGRKRGVPVVPHSKK